MPAGRRRLQRLHLARRATPARRQGSHTFLVRATDAAGNIDATPASFTWTIDTTKPTSAITFPAAAGIYRAATWNDFSGTAADTGGAALANVQISIQRVSNSLYWNGTAFADAVENWRTATGTAAWSLTFGVANFPADGNYTIRVRATDTATNVETPASRTFTIDTAAPNTTITAQPSDPTNSTAPSFSFTSTEGGSTFECQLDGGGYSACTSPKSYTGQTQGSHTFLVRATDPAGNVDATPASYTWTIDTTEPTSAITFPAAAGIYRTATWNDFSGTAADTGGAALANVQISIQRVSSSLYWNGSAFADAVENWRTATGAASWSLTFGVANFPADGNYTIRVRATDTATNVQSTPVSRTFTIDTAAPNTTISAQPNDPTNSTAPSFSFTSSEGGSTFECQLDGGGYSACTSPKSYTGVTQGSHPFLVRATDSAGNVDATPASYTWTIDTTEPTSTVTFPAAAGIYRTATWNDFSGTAADTGGSALANVQISIQRASSSLFWNGSAFADAVENWRTATGTAAWSLTFGVANFPADGNYTIRVRATDTATNAQSTPVSRTFTIDTAAPNTTISAQPSDPTNSTAPSFSFTSTEGGSTFECQLDGGGYSACTSPKSYTGQTQGSHTFQVRATDTAGNTDATPASFTWTIDTTNPTSTVSFPAAAGIYRTATWNDFCGTAADTGGAALANVQISIQRVSNSLFWNGTAFADAVENWRTATGTAAWSLTFAVANFPADGDYTIRVRATDTATNVQSTPVSRTFTIDTAAPNTTISAQPNDPTNSTAPSFSFTSTEGGSSFECQLDGGGYSACTSPKSYTSQTQASHTFLVRATDPAGNVDATPASYTWTIDTTDPTSTVTFPAAAGIYRTATWNDFSGTAADTGGAALANVQISIRRVSNSLYWNGTDFTDGSENWRTASGTSSWSLTFPVANFPADGDYTIRVRATDTASNVQTPSSRTFTIDTTAPNTTITAQPSNPTNSTAPSFSFTSNEAGSTFECQLDGGGYSACTSPKSYTGQTQGSHTFQVRATDAAGNVDASPAGNTWTIDTTDPSSTLSFPGAIDYNNGSWNDFAGAASDTGGAALANVQISIQRVSNSLYWNGTDFTDGSENWRTATGPGPGRSRSQPRTSRPTTTTSSATAPLTPPATSRLPRHAPSRPTTPIRRRRSRRSRAIRRARPRPPSTSARTSPARRSNASSTAPATRRAPRRRATRAFRRARTPSTSVQPTPPPTSTHRRPPSRGRSTRPPPRRSSRSRARAARTTTPTGSTSPARPLTRAAQGCST